MTPKRNYYGASGYDSHDLGITEAQKHKLLKPEPMQGCCRKGFFDGGSLGLRPPSVQHYLGFWFAQALKHEP